MNDFGVAMHFLGMIMVGNQDIWTLKYSQHVSNTCNITTDKSRRIKINPSEKLNKNKK